MEKKNKKTWCRKWRWNTGRDAGSKKKIRNKASGLNRDTESEIDELKQEIELLRNELFHYKNLKKIIWTG